MLVSENGCSQWGNCFSLAKYHTDSFLNKNLETTFVYKLKRKKNKSAVNDALLKNFQSHKFFTVRKLDKLMCDTTALETLSIAPRLNFT